jgi:alkanesulfonate monooxygenase SsuD/methylene tetrahydromethanopterin reductase-like flavin-dependent oxidoreductase (luciferase family)
MNGGGIASTPGLRIGVVVPTREAFLQLSPAGELIDFAVRAEDLGFDSVWVGDSLTARPRLEPLTLLAAIATRTNRAAIGTAALTGALRPTALAAHSIATIDQLADGRLVVGLGAGFPMQDTELEFAAAGAPYGRRIAQLERNVATWKWLWGDPSAPPPSGTTETIAQALRSIPPPARPGGPPLWLAGSGPKALDRAGRMFDGWLPYPTTVSDFETQRAAVHAAAADVGRATRIECAVYVTVAIDDRTARASERLDRFSNAYYGFSGETLRVIQAVVAGTPEECAEHLCGYVAVGADHLVLRIGDLDGNDRIDTLARVAELVRSTNSRRELAITQESR